MNAEDIKEGYELKTDMFGFEYAQRKATPKQQRLAELLFLPSVLAIAAVICWILFR